MSDPLKEAFDAGAEAGYIRGFNAALSEIRLTAAGLAMKPPVEVAPAKPGNVTTERMLETTRQINAAIAAAEANK